MALLSGFVERVALPEPSTGRIDHAGPESHTTWSISHLNPTFGGKAGSLQDVTMLHKVSTWKSISTHQDHNGRPMHRCRKTRITVRGVLLISTQHSQGRGAQYKKGL